MIARRVDQNASRAHGSGQAAGAEDNGFDIRGVGKHGEHHLRAIRHIGRAFARDGTLGGQRIDCRAAPVRHCDRISLGHQAARHRTPHEAQADEADTRLGHGCTLRRTVKTGRKMGAENG